MKISTYLICQLMTLSSLMFCADFVLGQQLEASVSADQTYVWSTIQLAVKVINAEDYDVPELPEIENCDVQFQGARSTNSSITVINGVTTKRESVTLIYQFMPLKPGKIEVPELEFLINGKSEKLQSFEFTAKESPTNDLMVVKLQGAESEVYVGQSLGLSLEILVKPFQDKRRDVTLDEAQMWLQLSSYSKLGVFAEEINRLAEQRKIPPCEQVLRKDDSGKEVTYYRYLIETEIYPDRVGRIEGSDVRVIFDYPLALGRRRSLFQSPRLAITRSRPIVEFAKVGVIEALPVPAEGKPLDYRGAVGEYEISTEATPNSVAAGDAITLRIAITGDGDLDRIQAPPLAEIDAVTVDFITEDQSLAGITRNGVKTFDTTIRPRRGGITKIPAIPFTFFAPNRKEYRTVYSEPIDIDVKAAEELSLDSIVNASPGNPSNEQPDAAKRALPLLTNDFSDSVLVSQSADATDRLPYFWLLLPIGFFATALVFRGLQGGWRLWSAMRPAKSTAKIAIEKARHAGQLVDAVGTFIAVRIGKTRVSGSIDFQSAAGFLRSQGFNDAAIEWECLCQSISRSSFASQDADSLAKLKPKFIAFVEQLEADYRSRSPVRIRNQNNSNSRRYSPLCILIAIGAGAMLNADRSFGQEHAGTLSGVQKQAILLKANQSYEAAEKASAGKTRNELYQRSAAQYQLLIDAGINNAGLFLNAANAYSSSGQIPQAIACCLSGLHLEPDHERLKQNLGVLRSKLELPETVQSADPESGWFANFNSNSLIEFSRQLSIDLGAAWLFYLTFFFSVIFWGLLSVFLFGFRLPGMKSLLAVTMFAMLLCGSGLYLATDFSRSFAIAKVENIELRSGDGVEFPVEHTLRPASGMELRVLVMRDDWLHVESPNQKTGWVNLESVIPVLSGPVSQR